MSGSELIKPAIEDVCVKVKLLLFLHPEHESLIEWRTRMLFLLVLLHVVRGWGAMDNIEITKLHFEISYKCYRCVCFAASSSCLNDVQGRRVAACEEARGRADRFPFLLNVRLTAKRHHYRNGITTTLYGPRVN